jgi:threonine dehydratase
MNQDGKLAVDAGALKAAAQRLQPYAVRTPLLSFPDIDTRLGFRLLVKAETLQRTGSFKFRGACNKLLLLREFQPAVKSVVAFSSGNHAQGVAAAASILGFKATIVMPSDAPAIKMANTKSFGAAVVLYDRKTESREAIAGDIALREGAAIVPPYDDPAIIAGQGTAGLEIAVDCTKSGIAPDMVLAPCSGGGLVAGVATAIKDQFPAASVFAVEPAGYDDLARSLKAGERLSNQPGPNSICDALMAQRPGEITFPIHRRLLAGSLVVDDQAVLSAMRFSLERLKLVIEPGGATSLAAALAHRKAWQGKTVVIVASGGNVDPEMMKRAIDADDPLIQ